MSFGQWLKERRKSLDLTQDELAQRVGCSDIAIRKMESGERRPSRQVAELLADLLNVPPAQREEFINFARGVEVNGDERLAESISAPGPNPSVASPGDLPAQLTRLIGREDVVAKLHDMLAQEAVRLLTLTGPPGIGKTRLALQVAHDVKNRSSTAVFFVGLASLNDPSLVMPTIARTLGPADKSTEESLLVRVQRSLRDKQVLLVLDNFEQILDASRVVLALLGGCPHLKVLVTSREGLRVSAEQQFHVPPLATADPAHLPSIESLPNLPAMALFIERARAVKPDFAITDGNAGAVAAICARLDGLPMAIELAAAHVALLTPQEILARLDSRLALRASRLRDIPERQRTLRTAIDWSYNLLDGGEQTLFARLGVFVGGCTLSAVQAVCNPTGNVPFDILRGLSSLIDKSLLKREGGVGESRYTMLETIHEYALERLAEVDSSNDEVQSIGRLHAEYFLALAQGTEMQLRGPEQVAWLNRLEEEHGNLRAALRWALERGETEMALALGGTLWKFWELHGYLAEGRRWLAAALSAADSGQDPQVRPFVRAKALFAAGRLAERQGDNASSRPLLEESLAIARRTGDKELIALVLHNLANLATYEGDFATGRLFAEESLAIRTEMEDKWGMANILHNLGFQAEGMGDLAASQEFYEQSLALSRELGDKWGAAYSLDGVAIRALEAGERERAGALLAEGLALRRELGDKSGIARSLERLAMVAGRQGRHVRAARLAGAADALRENEEIPIMPVDRAQHEETLALTHSRLNQPEWEQAWQEGQMMPTEQAIVYALEEQPDSPA